MNTYRLISSDSHVVEPRNLWEEWIEPAFRERAPRVVPEEERDQWIADSDVPIGTFGSVGQAGMRFEDRTQITHYGRADDIPPGGRDPHAHARDLDHDGIHADVIYPSVTLTAYMLPAGDLLSAILRAYNNWLGDFCSAYPGRLNGVAVLNVDNVDEAIGELDRTAKMGLVGACIPSAAGEVRYSDPSYEPLWAAAQDAGVPLSLHLFSNRWKPGMPAGVMMKKETADPSITVNMELSVRQSLADMIFSGVFDRYPKLRVGAIEFEACWAAYFAHTMDRAYKTAASLNRVRFQGGALPSDHFRRNCFVSFQEDEAAIRLRDHIGVKNLMWGNDYPHAESTFPKSREFVDRILAGIPEDEQRKIAGENAAELYHIT